MAIGRKTGGGSRKGIPNKATARAKVIAARIAERALVDGLTPLEAMLTTMRDAWAAGDRATACAIAKDAAPYLHPKLSAVEANVSALPPYEERLAKLFRDEPEQ